ncbi:DUF167 domain-containing protein [bacterium]|nr:DUF167 domain-containing protein [bacterium]
MKLKIKVIPKARKKMIKTGNDGVIRVYLNSPPADGKANKELIQYLSGELSIQKTSITIIKGASTRDKVLEIPDGTDIGALYK